MPTSDLPAELWLEILSYLPRSALRKMIGVNRFLFELALDDMYEEVRLISDDKATLKTFKQLNHNSVARRVRQLLIRPAFLPGMGETGERDDLRHKVERRVSSGFFYLKKLKNSFPSQSPANLQDSSYGVLSTARKAVKCCPNLREITIIVHDHVATSMFLSFLDSLWASDSIGPNLRKISIDTVVAKIPLFLKPLTKCAKVLTNLEEFNLSLSTSRHRHTSTDWYYATQALVSLFTAFKQTFTTVSFASMVIADLGAIFDPLPHLPKLKKFEFCAITNHRTLPNPEGLTRFISLHQSSLEIFIIKPHSRHVSFHHSDDAYTIWLNQQEPSNSVKLYSFSQLVLPQLHTLDVGLRDLDRYTIEPNLSTRRLLPCLYQITPNLVRLTMTDVKLSISRLTEILESLTPKGDDCPKLEELSVACYELSPYVFDMLSKRLSKLRALTLQYDQLSLSAISDLRRFSDAMQARSYSQWKLGYLRLLKPSSCGRGHPSVADMKVAAIPKDEESAPSHTLRGRISRTLGSIRRIGSMDEAYSTKTPLASLDGICCTVVPQDVLDLIVDILAGLAYDHGDHVARKALAQCLLVSRSFYDKARPLVFHSIIRKEQILPCENWDQRRDNLFFDIFEGDLLRESRPLATQVREITIAACLPTTAKMILLDGWGSSEEELDQQRQRLPRILNTLTNLDVIEVRLDGPKHLHWRAMYRGTRSSIRKLCRSARTLRFHNILGFPLSLLSVCVDIRKLSLSKIFLLQPEKDRWNQKALDDLETLEIADNGEDLLSTIVICRPTAFSKLKRLTVTLPSLKELCTVLQCSANSLITLEIFCSQNHFPFHPDTTSKLSALSTLRTIILHLSANLTLPECFPPHILIFFIAGLVENSPSSITNLVLKFVVDTTENDVVDRQEILPSAWQQRWKKLDLLLTSSSYPSLETMNIKFIEKQSPNNTAGVGHSDDTIPHSNSLAVDANERMILERNSSRWLTEYFEAALPRLHTSTVEMELEYCIIASRHVSGNRNT